MTIHPQAKTLEQLIQRFRARTLPASLLLAGPKGVGKWSVAFDLAKRIGCLHAAADASCGKCDSCRQIEQFAHPDIQFLFPLPADDKGWDEWYAPYLFGKQAKPFAPSFADPKHVIPIEAIRRFQSRLATRATLSKHKVGIIYEAERILPGTMDSLLKLLEEPPEQCFLIVVTDQPRILLPTILSRLQRVNIPALSQSFVIEHLRSAGTAADRAEPLARLARGSLYTIDALIDGEFFRLRETAWEMLAAGLKQSATATYARFADSAAIASRDRVEIVCAHWQCMVRDLAVLQSLPAGAAEAQSRLIYFDLYDSYTGAPASGTAGWHDRLNNRIERMRQELRRNVNARMAALDFLMGLPQLTTGS